MFAFLAELRNHWTLAGRRIELIELGGGTGAGDATGRVMIRGPLGLRRRATTRVLELHAPDHLGGIAEIGRRTRARVRWELAPASHRGTRVTLSVAVLSAGWPDRVLLAAGGRLWMRHVFAATLGRLAEQLDERPRSTARRAGGVATPAGHPAYPDVANLRSS